MNHEKSFQPDSSPPAFPPDIYFTESQSFGSIAGISGPLWESQNYIIHPRHADGLDFGIYWQVNAAAINPFGMSQEVSDHFLSQNYPRFCGCFIMGFDASNKL